MSIVGFVRERVFGEDAAFEQDHPRDDLGRFRKKETGIAVQPSLSGFEQRTKGFDLTPSRGRHNAISNVPLAPHFDEFEERLSRDSDLEESVVRLPKDSKYHNSPEEYKEAVLGAIDAYIQQSDLSIQIHRNAFEGALADGTFKNQHDTYSSMGHLDPEMRRTIEHDFFGVGLHANPNEYPVYGHFEVPVEKRDRFSTQLHQEMGDYYGTIQVVLKPEVKDRATYTLGDSLDDYGSTWPIPVGMLSSANMPNRLAKRAQDTYEVVKDPFALREMLGHYVEAQIHGGVSLDDIEVVRFSHFGSVRRMPEALAALEGNWGEGRDDIFEILQEKGIPFEYYDVGYEHSVRDISVANERLDYLRDTYGMKIIRRPGE